MSFNFQLERNKSKMFASTAQSSVNIYRRINIYEYKNSPHVYDSLLTV